MRVGIAVIGVVLLIIGAVLMFVPVQNQGQKTVNSGYAETFSVSGFSLTGNIPVKISWTANAQVEMAAATCKGTCSATSLSGYSNLAYENGTSGTFTLNQPSGGSVVVALVPTASGGGSASSTVTVTTAMTTIGTILLFVGILLIILGVVIPSKRRAAPAAMPPAQEAPGAMPPMAEPSDPASPPASP